jgi:mycothiol synthase
MIVRHYEPGDEAQVLRLWNAAWWADKTTAEFFQEKVLMEPNIGEEGLFVAEDHGRIIGAANAFVRSTDLPWGYAGKSALFSKKGFFFPIFPVVACGNDGVGSELLRAGEAYLHDRGRTIVSVCEYYPLFYPDGIDRERYPELHSFFIANGYQPSDTSYSMSRDLRNHQFTAEACNLESRLAEEGISFTPYRPQYLIATRRFLLKEFPAWISCFAHKVVVRAPWHEMILAVQKDEVIGYCQYNYYGLVERVGPFGVARAMQGKGVGYVLVARLLGTMAECGYQLAYFCSAGQRQAKFYAKNGFTVFREKTIFEKSITGQ